MSVANYLIIGSGLSGFTTSMKKPNSLILSKKLSNKNTDVVKAKNFYESHQIGGNTNIWGGYVNLKIDKVVLINAQYKITRWKKNSIYKKDRWF